MPQRKHSAATASEELGSPALNSFLDSITSEMRELQDVLAEMAARYVEMNRALNCAKLENERLTRENEHLRSNRRVLIAGLCADDVPPAAEVLN